LLRGPQTPGELRGRTERMHHFDDIEQVQASLQKLMQREPPLATMLPRQPGAREARYAHLLSGAIDVSALEPAPPPTSAHSAGGDERVHRLEEEVAELRARLDDLQRQVADLRAQFQ
jgi:uncharacterized protein YceH (UPF0502 family)